MTGPRIGSLFSGYGGLDMGVQAVLGGDVVWHCDIEPASTRLLAHHHPDTPNLGDITAVEWGELEQIDVLTGGFPCQDVSAAGRRAGMRPGTRSGLWTHMARAINVLRPRLVVIENVRGLLSAEAACDVEPCPWCLGDHEHRPLRALGAVLGDLAVLGYDARWVGVRAANAGAPHARYRVFIAAQPAEDADCAAGSERGIAAPGQAASWRSRANAGRSGRARVARWGDYAPAIGRWELTLGRPAPSPTQTGQRGGQQLSPVFVEWLMGLPAGWVTGVPGVSRNEQLKLLGNGVVPQQAELALRHLLGGPALEVAA